MIPAETEIGAEIPPGPTALYRLYADDGALLYVGVADDLRDRLLTHEREKPWWPAVVRKTASWYDTRKDAELAEAAVIADEHPVHNVRTYSGLLGRARVPREALKVDTPVELKLMRRLHMYRLDHGVDLRDQVTMAV